MLKLKLKILTILLDKKLLFIGIDEYFLTLMSVCKNKNQACCGGWIGFNGFDQNGLEWNDCILKSKARDNPSQVAPSHTDITRDARGSNLLLDDDYR